MLSVILLVITLAVTTIVTAFANQALNTSIQGFSLWIIIPIGAILIGGLAASGIFIGQKISKGTLKSYFFAFAIIAGVASFFTTTYVDYHLSVEAIKTEYSEYIDRFSEEEKQEFWDEVSFSKYLENIYNNSTISLSSRSNKSTKIENNLVSIASFWLSVIGAGLGGLFVTSMAIGDRTKCKKCRQYRDLKYTIKTDYENFDDIVKAVEESKDLGKTISEFLNKYPNDKKLYKRPPHVTVKIMRCRKCGEGEVVIEQTAMANGQETKVGNLVKKLSANNLDTVLNTMANLQIKESH